MVPTALEFAWELVAAGTVAAGAELVIEEVPATVRCWGCRAESTLMAFPAHCAACGALAVEVIGGEELLVDALELQEEALTGG